MIVLETERLRLRYQTLDDAAFILELVNDPAWLQYIGDRGVRTLEDARAYIANGAIRSYERDGFGFYLVERKEDRTLLGMCGLVRREGLEDVDIGYAFLPAYRGRGYAHEAASAVMQYATQTLGLSRVVAITAQDNHASGRLLEKLGLRFERLIQLPNAPEWLKLFVYDAAQAESDAKVLR
ncbi:GNAT family N-acetyltransferase [Brevibacillus sp. GCM10020057]|uniref:GNAT family N-acetyltransferase n=1 Tax=Brevibacillus sp. GCM10020057 TaxID=3317327 RepID=UPI003624B0BC